MFGLDVPNSNSAKGSVVYPSAGIGFWPRFSAMRLFHANISLGLCYMVIFASYVVIFASYVFIFVGYVVIFAGRYEPRAISEFTHVSCVNHQ